MFFERLRFWRRTAEPTGPDPVTQLLARLDGAGVVAVAQALKQLHESGVVPDYEALLQRTYTRFLRPGDVIFDVGAHNGRHLSQFIKLVGDTGKIVAFEPIPFFGQHLTTTYAGQKNVTIHRCALSATTGEIEFVHAIDTPEESGIRRRIFNQPDTRTETINVRVDTFDRVASGIPRLDYVKIDVEGAEIDVLRGGVETLNRLRPIMSIEYGHPSYSVYGHTNMTLLNWARENGYDLTDLFGNPVESADQWAAVCDCSYWDYFAVPTEKLEKWRMLVAPGSGSASRTF